MRKGFWSVAALAGFALWYFYAGGTLNLDAMKKRIVKEAQEAVAQKTAPDDVAALAMKAINLTQGEHGAELWRLKAEWGNVRRRDDIMELEKPKFMYYMAPDNLPLSVTSEKGELDQKKRIVKFIGSVVTTYQDRVVNAPIMVYSDTTRELTFPDSATLRSANMTGSADSFVWNLNEKKLTGFGNVNVSFDNNAAVAPAGRGSGHKTPAKNGP